MQSAISLYFNELNVHTLADFCRNPSLETAWDVDLTEIGQHHDVTAELTFANTFT